VRNAPTVGFAQEGATGGPATAGAHPAPNPEDELMENENVNKRKMKLVATFSEYCYGGPEEGGWRYTSTVVLGV
jgi:hypothetical protein